MPGLTLSLHDLKIQFKSPQGLMSSPTTAGPFPPLPPLPSLLAMVRRARALAGWLEGWREREFTTSRVPDRLMAKAAFLFGFTKVEEKVSYTEMVYGNRNHHSYVSLLRH